MSRGTCILFIEDKDIREDVINQAKATGMKAKQHLLNEKEIIFTGSFEAIINLGAYNSQKGYDLKPIFPDVVKLNMKEQSDN